MIEVTRIDQRKVSLAPEAIAQVTDAGTSQAWHGIRANVQTFDGKWIEVQETRAEVVQRIDQARRRT